MGSAPFARSLLLLLLTGTCLTRPPIPHTHTLHTYNRHLRSDGQRRHYATNGARNEARTPCPHAHREGVLRMLHI